MRARRLVDVGRREATIVLAAVAPCAAVVLGALDVLKDSTALWLAVWLGVGTLAVQGLRYARIEQLGGLATLAVIGTNLTLGLLIVALKVAVANGLPPSRQTGAKLPAMAVEELQQGLQPEPSEERRGVLRYYDLAKRAEWQTHDLPWNDASADSRGARVGAEAGPPQGRVALGHHAAVPGRHPRGEDGRPAPESRGAPRGAALLHDDGPGRGSPRRGLAQAPRRGRRPGRARSPSRRAGTHVPGRPRPARGEGLPHAGFLRAPDHLLVPPDRPLLARHGARGPLQPADDRRRDPPRRRHGLRARAARERHEADEAEARHGGRIGCSRSSSSTLSGGPRSAPGSGARCTAATSSGSARTSTTASGSRTRSASTSATSSCPTSASRLRPLRPCRAARRASSSSASVSVLLEQAADRRGVAAGGGLQPRRALVRELRIRHPAVVGARGPHDETVLLEALRAAA